MDLKDKTCIITGATSGIGKVTALAVAAEGCRLVLPLRNMQKGEALKEEILQKTGNEHVELFPCRLDSFESIREFAGKFREKYSGLHLLVNNAGLWEMKRKTSEDGIEMNFAVNHLAPFLLTNLLLDVIKKSSPARIINVASEAHRQGKMRFDDLEGEKKWSGFRSYAQSKLANILFTRKLSAMVAENGITVNSLHPGVVSTRLFDKMPPFLRGIFRLFMISPEKGAQTSIYLATSPEVEKTTGKYFAKKKIKKPNAEALSDANADKLWEVSLRYTGLEKNKTS